MANIAVQDTCGDVDESISGPAREAMFQLESQLVQKLEGFLGSADNPFTPLALASEFNYVEGRVDLVASNGDGELFSFEAKLKRWKTAVYQAFRNTSFSHYSYVVLPADAVQQAIKRRHEFERRGVGLCAVAHHELIVHIPATRQRPLHPWLTNTAIEYIREENSVD